MQHSSPSQNDVGEHSEKLAAYSSLLRQLMPSIARWLLVLLLAVGVYFFHGFIGPAMAAIVIGISTWPFYQRVLRFVKGDTIWGASIALLLIVAFLVIPIGVIVRFAVVEFGIWLNWAITVNEVGASAPDWLSGIPVVGAWLKNNWDMHIGTPGAIEEIVKAISGNHISNIYYGVIEAGATIFHVALTLLFMLITLFFVYKDGVSFTRQLDHVGEAMFPARWHRFSRLVPAAINATVMGMGVIAVAEGIILGVAYSLAGVPYPVILGVITGFMALIPGGAPLSFTLVSVYLLASGSTYAGVALFCWGTFELFMVDKFVRPKLVGGPIKLPFLPTFFGLVGGVKTLGFLGLFIGPVIMALLVALWREWLRELDFYKPKDDQGAVQAE